MRTCSSLQITFLWGNFLHSITLLWTIFRRLVPFLWTNIRTRKCTNTKKTRKKDEENTKDTRNFAYFRPNRGQIIGRKQPVDLWKISGLNWTTEKQRVKMTRWNQRLKMSLLGDQGFGQTSDRVRAQSRKDRVQRPRKRASLYRRRQENRMGRGWKGLPCKPDQL